MLRSFLLSCFILFFCADLSAQKYGNALGIRVDQSILGIHRTVGVYFKQRMFKTGTVDALLAFNTNEVHVKGLLNIHKPILYKGLNYFYGAGAHVGMYRGRGPFIGLDLSVGLELKVPALPILISADLAPSVHVNHPKQIQLLTSVAVLFVLRSERDIRRNRRKRNKKKEDRPVRERFEDLFSR